MPIKKTVEEWIDSVDYSDDPNYVPSQFALEFVNFIKLVNGERGEENKTPVMHYKMLDEIPGKRQDIVNMCSRGTAKSALLAEYLFLYIAVYEKIPNFGSVDYALYVSDSIENGVKKMRKRIERRWDNSSFLRHYIPETRFTDVRWAFKNIEGKEFVVTGHGAQTGVRGTVELNTRPQLAILDDLLSDDDARSKTIIASIEDTVYKAIDHALHPTKRKVIWSGTPFNAKDPLYKAVESGAWYVNVYPICEEYPCSEKDFRGAWEDRFTYASIKASYDKALQVGKIDAFNQELMLRIMSDEDRLIQDCDITWYKRKAVLDNKGLFNFYITTDFATSEAKSADLSVISVWAYNNKGDWLWVDGIVERRLMDKNIDDLFRLVQLYNPQQVGIEVSGQQGGFIPWIQGEMLTRNIYFTLATDTNNGKPGIKPNTNKMERFNIVVPWFKLNRIWFPEERKTSPEMVEFMNELKLAAVSGFKSKHDDCGIFNLLVDTPKGATRLGLLKNGDSVFTYKHDNRLTGKVKQHRMTGIKGVYKILLNDDTELMFSEYHPILTSKGYKLLKDLQEGDSLMRDIKCKLSMIALNGQSKRADIINPLPELQMDLERIGYISIFMKLNWVKYPKDMKYIIEIMIKIITNYLISSYSQVINIELNIQSNKKRMVKNSESMLKKIMKKCRHWLNWEKQDYIQEKQKEELQEIEKENVKIVKNNLLWTVKLKRILNSVVVNAHKHMLEIIIRLLKPVLSAQLPLNKKQEIRNYVVQCVLKERRLRRKHKLQQKNVKSVDSYSQQVYEKLHVEENAKELEKIGWNKNVEKVKINKIFFLGYLPTYNFEIEDTHNYSVQGGIIVHNCIDTVSQLSSLTPWKPSEVSPMTDKDQSGLWDLDIEEASDHLESYIV